MHAIVVLGDVRSHTIRIEKKAYWKKQAHCNAPSESVQFYLLGGAVMMANTVRLALQSIGKETQPRVSTVGDSTRVPVFGLEPPASIEKSTFGETWEWVLRPFSLQGDSRMRPRLQEFSQKPAAAEQCVPLDPKLKDLLADRSKVFKEDPNLKEQERARDSARLTGDQSPPDRDKSDWELRCRHANALGRCPDIVVIDDLNQITRLPFTEVDSGSSADFTSTEYDAPVQHYKAALREVLFRCQEVVKKDYGVSLNRCMQPVIFGSIKGNLETALSAAVKDPSEPARPLSKTIWRHLLDNDGLRRRTVILLDADDLREVHLPISTGLSWERTAQDVLTQMRMSPQMRPFLEFDQVIVRFGATGALHIARRGQSTTNTLHFLPQHDDATWCVGSRNGSLLGLTSLFAASIVLALVKSCDDSGAPYVSDLPDAISSALQDTIRRCAWFYSIEGYGETCYTNLQRRFKQNSNPAAEETLLPSCIFEPASFQEPKRIIDRQGNIKLPLVTKADIPNGISSGDWSILNRSAQTEISEVAREIVLYGPRSVLNQQPILLTDKVAAVQTAIKDGFQSFASWSSIPQAETCRGFAQIIASNLAREVTAQDPQFYLPPAFLTRSREQVKDWLVTMDEGSMPLWQRLQASVTEFLAYFSSGSPNRDDAEKILTNLLRNDQRLAQFTEAVDKIFKTPTRREPLAAPFAEYGESLTVVDRREIEGYRAIEKLMRRHIEDVKEQKNERPLSIAVFGPPGSGKSMAVKKINESLNEKSTTVLEAFNLAQYTSIKDLIDAFDKIHSSGTGTRVPIAFFDEFDARFPGAREPLGWLKFFLSPMEDGTFRNHPIRNSILVFAGGTSSTFAEFSLDDRSRSDPQWIKFSKAKGPDFVSRIRGHINIVGINPTGADDALYLMRRAVVVRSMLTQMQELAPGEKARIDDNILRAILQVPEYWHGGRALRMLLELCTHHDGRISSSAVPPIQQINMLVDGQAFLNRLMGIE